MRSLSRLLTVSQAYKQGTERRTMVINKCEATAWEDLGSSTYAPQFNLPPSPMSAAIIIPIRIRAPTILGRPLRMVCLTGAADECYCSVGPRSNSAFERFWASVENQLRQHLRGKEMFVSRKKRIQRNRRLHRHWLPIFIEWCFDLEYVQQRSSGEEQGFIREVSAISYGKKRWRHAWCEEAK